MFVENVLHLWEIFIMFGIITLKVTDSFVDLYNYYFYYNVFIKIIFFTFLKKYYF